MFTPLEQVYWHETLPFHFYRLSSLDMKSVFDLLPSCIANLYFAREPVLFNAACRIDSVSP